VPQTLRTRDFIGAPLEFAATKVMVCEHAASCIRHCPIGVFLYITPPQIATPPSLRDKHFATSGLCSTTCRVLRRLDYAAELIGVQEQYRGTVKLIQSPEKCDGPNDKLSGA
jgi:hypothetical protein